MTWRRTAPGAEPESNDHHTDCEEVEQLADLFGSQPQDLVAPQLAGKPMPKTLMERQQVVEQGKEEHASGDEEQPVVARAPGEGVHTGNDRGEDEVTQQLPERAIDFEIKGHR